MEEVESSVEAEMCDFMTKLSDIEHHSDAAFLSALRTLMWGMYTAFPTQADNWIVECLELTRERMQLNSRAATIYRGAQPEMQTRNER